MVNIVSPRDASAQGAMSMIRNASGSSGSLFSALSGANNGSSAPMLFSALGGNSGSFQSTDSILQKQKVDSAKLAMYSNAAERINYMQQGKHTPTEDWEKIVGYAMNKGLPTVTFIDSNGAMGAQLQIESDLANFNANQQNELLITMDQISTMAQKIQANQTNDGWIAKLKGASNDVYLVANYVLSPQDSTPNNWEQTAVLAARNGQPVKISLDAKGELQSIDQRFDPALAELPASMQTKLANAIHSIPTTIKNGTALRSWELEAANMAASKIPYYLEIDPTAYELDPTTGRLSAGKIIVRENSPENITPKFLKTAPYPDIGDDSDTLKKVAEFIKDKKPYFLDIEGNGQIVPKEITGRSLFKYNTPKNTAVNALGTGGILSLFA